MGTLRWSGRLGSQARNAQPGVVDNLPAHASEVVPALNQLDGAFEVEATALELSDDLLKLVVRGFKGPRLVRGAAQWHQPYWSVDRGANERSAWHQG